VVAAAVGLLFGVHPLTVEPIPWTGERKTLLAAFFAISCLVIYVTFARKNNRKLFWGCLAAYVLALMSKPTSTPLPVVMLLMDFWPLKRLSKRSLWEKVPFFVVGGISGIITYISQARTASVITPEEYGLLRIPFVFCHNIIFYLYKMVWPVDLSPHYAFPRDIGLSNPAILAGVIGTCVLIPTLFILLRRTRSALTGWLIFFLMVLPTMQALQFSDVIASDKFVYLPSLGILLILACFLSWLWAKSGLRAVLIIVVLVLAVAEAGATRKQIGHWQDTISLYAHMVDVEPDAISPRNNLGVAYAEANDIPRAMEQFEIALRMDSNDEQATFNVARVREEHGRIDEALIGYRSVLERWPNNITSACSAYSAIGRILKIKGDFEGAIATYREGIKFRFDNGELHSGLASTLFEMGRLEEAIPEYRTAIQFVPDSKLYNNLGLALAATGDIDGAISSYKDAIRHDPRNAEAHYNYGNMLLTMGKPAQAAGEFEKAIKLKPDYVKALGNLAVAFAQLGKADEAIENFLLVIELDPNDPAAYFNLASILEGQGKLDEAIENLRKVTELAPSDVGARSELGRLLLQQGKVDEALVEFTTALKFDPMYKDAVDGMKKALEIKAGKEQPASKPANP